MHQSAFIDGKLMCPNGRQFKQLSLQPRNSKNGVIITYVFLLNTLNFSPAPTALAQNYLTMSKNVKIQQITSFALSAREHVSFVKANVT